ncbi:MAG TPA: hypothetical protein VJ812_07370 [Gemmatimonadaceae bacterium]|nr:hypothetical protein [Gemmatimonadaceae bacterium]
MLLLEPLMRRMTFAFAALALVACSDGSGPDAREQFAGIWDLVSVDGQAVPVELAAGPPARVELLSIELDFTSPTLPGVETRSFRSTPTAGGAPSLVGGMTEVSFEVEDDQVTIINTGSGLPDDVGTLDDDTLTISRSVLGVYRVHVYQKRP